LECPGFGVLISVSLILATSPGGIGTI
jgi:hypothetical protein